MATNLGEHDRHLLVRQLLHEFAKLVPCGTHNQERSPAADNRDRARGCGGLIVRGMSVPLLILVGMVDRRGGERRTGGAADSTTPGDPDRATPTPTDLSDNAAGLGVAFEAARRRRRDDGTSTRSWEVGAKGERDAGEMLARLTAVGWWDRLRGRRSAWRVLHSVALRTAGGDERGDIDHVVIGPPGVVTINTKHHPRGNIMVDGDEVTVNRRRTDYIAKSRREAERARSMLVAALTTAGHADLGAQLRVQPLILVVGTMPRVQREPDGVPVVPLQRLLTTVAKLPVRLDEQQVEAVFAVACRRESWTLPA